METRFLDRINMDLEDNGAAVVTVADGAVFVFKCDTLNNMIEKARNKGKNEVVIFVKDSSKLQ